MTDQEMGLSQENCAAIKLLEESIHFEILQKYSRSPVALWEKEVGKNPLIRWLQINGDEKTKKHDSKTIERRGGRRYLQMWQDLRKPLTERLRTMKPEQWSPKENHPVASPAHVRQWTNKNLHMPRRKGVDARDWTQWSPYRQPQFDQQLGRISDPISPTNVFFPQTLPDLFTRCS